MISIRRSARISAVAAAALMAVTAMSGGTASGTPKDPRTDTPGQAKTVTLAAELTELNNSGASGTATATVRNQLIRQIHVHAEGLTPDAPHAQHIHYGEQARNECPSLFDDTD